jgi:DNA polymerase-3 subunit epsilon
VHGITDEMLADKPRFAEIVDDLLAFVGDGRLVIHNAEFDLRFLNHELKRIGRPALACAYEDTLALARRQFPGAPASLDALCRRFAVDLSERDKHGALLDCRLLAAVYLELVGGRQPTLDVVIDLGAAGSTVVVARPHRPARPHSPLPDELVAHKAMLGELKQPIWLSA